MSNIYSKYLSLDEAENSTEHALMSFIDYDGVEKYIAVDIVLNEQHTISIEVTDSPIETGMSITDLIFVKPRQFSMTCTITNQKSRYIDAINGDDAGIVAEAKADASATYKRMSDNSVPQFEYSEAFFRYKLIEIVASQGLPWNLRTRIGKLYGYVITSLTTSAGADTNDEITFSLTFKETNEVEAIIGVSANLARKRTFQNKEKDAKKVLKGALDVVARNYPQMKTMMTLVKCFPKFEKTKTMAKWMMTALANWQTGASGKGEQDCMAIKKAGKRDMTAAEKAEVDKGLMPANAIKPKGGK